MDLALSQALDDFSKKPTKINADYLLNLARFECEDRMISGATYISIENKVKKWIESNE